jgi:hypothetical protein
MSRTIEVMDDKKVFFKDNNYILILFLFVLNLLRVSCLKMILHNRGELRMLPEVLTLTKSIKLGPGIGGDGLGLT